MKPRYAAASTLNLPLHFASFAVASLLVYVVVMAMLTQRFAIADGVGWTIVMCALIWRVQAVRRYEILDDRIRFVGLLGSTTLRFRRSGASTLSRRACCTSCRSADGGARCRSSAQVFG